MTTSRSRTATNSRQARCGIPGDAHARPPAPALVLPSSRTTSVRTPRRRDAGPTLNPLPGRGSVSHSAAGGAAGRGAGRIPATPAARSAALVRAARQGLDDRLGAADEPRAQQDRRPGGVRRALGRDLRASATDRRARGGAQPRAVPRGTAAARAARCALGELLDVRSADAHAAGDAPGAVNVPLDGSSVGTKAGFVLDHDEPITIHASSVDETDPRRAPPTTPPPSRRAHALELATTSGWSRSAWTSSRCSANDAAEVLDVRERDAADEATPSAGYHPMQARVWLSATSSTTGGRC